jgi:hypothetical protein
METNVINLRSRLADEKWAEAQKKRIARFGSYCIGRWNRVEEWDQDLAGLTAQLLGIWAFKLACGTAVPESIQPMAEAYLTRHRAEIEKELNTARFSRRDQIFWTLQIRSRAGSLHIKHRAESITEKGRSPRL